MLTNPDKKFMVIGIHPELSTPLTRTLANQMEDPVFVPSPEELQEQEEALKSQQKHQAERIEFFLDIIKKDHNLGKMLSDGQKRILNELQNVTLPEIYKYVRKDIEGVTNTTLPS